MKKSGYINEKWRCVNMNNQELNTELYKQLLAEQEIYRIWLMKQTPSEILRHAYEYSVREDILMVLENNDLSSKQAEAFLKSSKILDEIFHEIEKRETNYMDAVLDSIINRANKLLLQQEMSLKLFNLPVYPYSLEYANRHLELELFQSSHKANIDCRDAIESAIADNYHNNILGKAAVKQVVGRFGYDRVFYVLANTVLYKLEDGRISSNNKAWAKTILDNADKNLENYDYNVEFIIDHCNPGLVDLFLTEVRNDYLLTLPLNQEDIVKEAQRLLNKFLAIQEPNSPGGTQYMVQISQDFLCRASSEDQARLVALLPFQSFSLSMLKDRKGIFAFIDKTEDRNKSLNHVSLSDKLKVKTNRNVTAKKKEEKKIDKEI